MSERMEITSTDLMACPFCGGECAHGTTKYSETTKREQGLEQRVWHFVNCIVCGVSNAGIIGGYKTPEQAAAKWNTRHANTETETSERSEA
jgi:hypothetical protein